MSTAVAAPARSESSLPPILSALAPNLPRNTALPRLRTNGLLLLLYVWITLQPTYYRFIKQSWIIPLSWIIGRDWAEYLTGGAEMITFFCLAWNTFEAYYSLKHPAKTPAPMPAAAPIARTPTARQATHRRLQSTPKTPLPSSFTPTQTPMSNAPFPALSFSPIRSIGSPQTSPLKASQSFTSSLSTSYLASSSSSSLNASFLSESGFSPRVGRALDASTMNRLISELDTP